MTIKYFSYKRDDQAGLLLLISNFYVCIFFLLVCQTSVDLTFILDSSGSVGRYNFGRIKTFVKNVIDFFNIGTNGTHVAVVTYSTWPTLEFNLKAYYTKISIKNAVGNIRYNGGQTYTADALDFARKNIFTITQVSECKNYLQLLYTV